MTSLPDPELDAFSKHLSRIRPTLPEDAQPFASNLITQIKEYLAGDENDRAALRPMMFVQLVRFESYHRAL